MAKPYSEDLRRRVVEAIDGEAREGRRRAPSRSVAGR
jgi:hypothetical protein